MHTHKYMQKRLYPTLQQTDKQERKVLFRKFSMGVGMYTGS